MNLEKITYKPDSLSHHDRNIQYWITQGITIDGIHFSIEEYFIQDNVLYAIISTDKRTFYKYPISDISNGNNEDISKLIDELEKNSTKTQKLDERLSSFESRKDNDNQTLILNNNILTISNGNSVVLPESKSDDVSTYSSLDDKSAIDNFIKGNSYTGSDNNFSFPMAQLGKLEALVSEYGTMYLRTRHAEGGTISTSINPVKVHFISYEDESDTAKVLKTFLDNSDEKFKEGRLEMLDINMYPTLLRYKDSSGKVFRVTNGLDYGSLNYASLTEDGNITFDADSLYTKVILDSSVDSVSGEEHRLTSYDRMKSENYIDKSVIVSKMYEHESGTIFEIVQMLDTLGISPLPELKGYNRYKLTYICKSYIDDKVYISKFIPSTSSSHSEAIVKIKEDGVIKDLNVQVGFPAVTLGV